MLGSYIFDNSAEVIIGNYKRTQIQSFTFTVFSSPKYRFAFDRSKCGENVIIKLYEVDKKGENKELVYTSQSSEEITKDISDPGRRYLVEVIVPANSDPGCLGLILGFKMHQEQEARKKRAPRIKFKD